MECEKIEASVGCSSAEEEMVCLGDGSIHNNRNNEVGAKKTVECKKDAENQNCQKVVLGNNPNDDEKCSRHPDGNRKTKACCKREVAKLRKQFDELKKECERLRALILEKLLELSNLLVQYERTKSSRYAYMPDKKPSEETIVKIAGTIFPEFRRVERILKFLAELIKENKFDDAEN